MEKKPSLDTNTIITAGSVAILSLFVIFLYSTNKGEWQNQIEDNTQTVKALQKENERLRDELKRLSTNDSLRTSSVYNNHFIGYGEMGFRLYGLFKDKKGIFSRQDVADKFFIYSADAIKVIYVGAESWFLVPVKGVHFVNKGETLEQLAKKYYMQKSDYTLIRDFNGELKAGNFVYIPFNSKEKEVVQPFVPAAKPKTTISNENTTTNNTAASTPDK